MQHATAPTPSAAEPPRGDVPAAVLAVLTLPDFDELTADQARGADCTWCRTRLPKGGAVDLGERRHAGVTLFLRSCRRCLAAAAHRGLLDHAPGCAPCTNSAAECPIGRGLYRLIRGGRR
ncbi:hypothetical protein AQJ30_27655 [Streptomyces longwoodensis]|uniref:Uncharacterized protein n=1 Tax=Streptomyces longwoodensis TaxID=68231 RepID=A0A101QRY1_9ACTN|nr:hypothetical protein [Streptomyces longwoodensis]KUN34847.1 hypothetical protein AQJ30_27655 [Streptomyces longwoodensis]